MKTTYISKPGGSRPNEDAVVHGKDWLAVLDGASGLSGHRFKTFPSDAAWLATTFARAFKEAATEGLGDLRRMIRRANSTVLGEYLQEEQKNGPIQPIDRPSASGAMIVKRGTLLEVCLIGDCSVVLSWDRRNVVISDPRVAKFDAVALAELKRLLAAGNTTGSAMALLRPLLLANRAMKNHADGYGIIEPTESWLDLALFHRFEIPAHGRMMCCTDGFASLVEPFKVYPNLITLAQAVSESNGLAAAEAKLIAAASTDPTCERMIRFKKLDDFSCAFAKWG